MPIEIWNRRDRSWESLPQASATAIGPNEYEVVIQKILGVHRPNFLDTAKLRIQGRESVQVLGTNINSPNGIYSTLTLVVQVE